MTDFNESKLSKIIARRIIAPEDRSQLLPFCTPIYCPTYNGVRASRVTVINPNTNSFLQDASIDNTTFIGSQLARNNARLNSKINNVGGVSISASGIATFSTGKYLSINDADTISKLNKIVITGILPKSIENPISLVTFTQANGAAKELRIMQNGNLLDCRLDNGVEIISTTIGKVKFNREFSIVINIDTSTGTRNAEIHLSDIVEGRPNATKKVSLQSYNLVTFAVASDANYKMDLAESSITVGDEAFTMYNADTTVVTNPNNVDNTFDVVMNVPVRHTYFVPHQVDLETDVNLINMIKSDFGVRFKKAVSDEILKQIIAQSASITKLNMGSSVAEAMGTVIADNMANGTGQKYSIYKYDNGAPVVTTKSSSQPNIDDMAIDKEDSDDLVKDAPVNFKSDYALKDDVAVPALYYCEKPTLIFDYPKFEEYQQGLCSGAVKDYADKMVNVDTTKIDFSSVGEGIFGTNDTFAVAFTQPKITIAPDKDYFADNICVEINFGVHLVHTDNLKVFI